MDILEVIPFEKKKNGLQCSQRLSWAAMAQYCATNIGPWESSVSGSSKIRWTFAVLNGMSNSGKGVAESFEKVRLQGILPSLSSVNKRHDIKPSTPDYYRDSLQVAQANQVRLADSLFRQSDILYERI
jgi:hypothetical protein